MRLYKVKTLTNLTIQTNWLFKKKTSDCWFTRKTRFIYARNKNEAEIKYKKLFFEQIFKEHKNNAFILSCIRWSADDRSNNMRFDLSFNQTIKNINESIIVSDEIIKDTIDYVKIRTMANDFRNWFMQSCENNVNADEFDEIFK